MLSNIKFSNENELVTGYPPNRKGDEEIIFEYMILMAMFFRQFYYYNFTDYKTLVIQTKIPFAK
jgi:hypothetical protein